MDKKIILTFFSTNSVMTCRDIIAVLPGTRVQLWNLQLMSSAGPIVGHYVPIFFPDLIFFLLFLHPISPPFLFSFPSSKVLDTRHMKEHLPPLPPEISWYSFLMAESTPGTWTWKKSQMTRPGIDPGTFRLVAQRLNHHATPEFIP